MKKYLARLTNMYFIARYTQDVTLVYTIGLGIWCVSWMMVS
jgi:hypothetical protein